MKKKVQFREAALFASKAKINISLKNFERLRVKNFFLILVFESYAIILAFLAHCGRGHAHTKDIFVNGIFYGS